MIALHFGLGEYSKSKIKLDKLIKFSNNLCYQATFELQNGASSLETVCNVVSKLENCEETNAGIGSSLTYNGMVEMEASIMDGNSGLFGSVSCVRNYKNPVKIAKVILENQKNKNINGLIKPQFLSGIGAEEFAKKNGFMEFDNELLKTKKTKKLYYKNKYLINENICDMKMDTVGAICCDINGNISVAASSGGISLRPEGRIGHVSLPTGSGIWIDQTNKIAVCTTGVGELIAYDNTARRVCDLISIDDDVDIVDRLKTHFNKLNKNPAGWPCQIGFLGLQVYENGSRRVISCITGSELLIGYSDINYVANSHLMQYNDTNGSNILIQEWFFSKK